MYALMRRYLIFAVVCLVGLVVSRAVQAQIDADIFRDEMSQTEVQTFNSEVWQIAHRGLNGRAIDDAIIWGAGGSRWKLKNKSGSARSISKYFETFIWSGPEIFFDTVFCPGEHERRGYSSFLKVAGHIDFSQFNGENRGPFLPQRVTLKTRPGGSSKASKDNCTAATEVSDYLEARVMFEVTTGSDDSLKLDFYSPDRKTPISLIYEPDHSFEPLAQSSWKLTKKNGAPAEFCAPVKISSIGTLEAGCCNSLNSEIIKTTVGWTIGGGGSMTAAGCGEKRRNQADAQMAASLAGGFYINNEGKLIAGEFVFDPVSDLGKAQGKWRLSDAEGREYRGRIFPLPNRLKIHQTDALKDLDVILTIKADRLSILSNCVVYNAEIIKRKAGYLRLGQTEREKIQNCTEAQEGVKQGASLLVGHFVGKNAAIKLDYDRQSDSLTLTRAGIGATAASVSGEFERIE